MVSSANCAMVLLGGLSSQSCVELLIACILINGTDIMPDLLHAYVDRFFAFVFVTAN